MRSSAAFFANFSLAICKFCSLRNRIASLISADGAGAGGRAEAGAGTGAGRASEYGRFCPALCAFANWARRLFPQVKPL